MDGINTQINSSAVGGNGTSELVGVNADTAKVNAKAFFTLNNAKTVAKQFSTQVVSKAVKSIGSRTGNYVLQERMQSSVNAVTKIAGIGFAFAANPIVGAFTLVSEGIGFALDVAERNREIEWHNRAASELARRAGYLTDQNR